MSTSPGAPRLPTVSGPASVRPSTAVPPAELVRLVDLAVGQRVQATVLEPPAAGRALVGLLGGIVEAATNLPLEAGRNYEFTVAAIEPSIVLRAPRPVTVPQFGAVVDAGLLGPSAPDVAAMLQRAVRALAPGDAPAQGESADSGRALATAMARVADGAPTAADLQQIARSVGHDQEARVSRLAEHPPLDVLRELRTTLKAQALALLAEPASGADSERREAAASLVRGLGAIEVDNAARTEQGNPTWLPLPAPAGGFLRDARMFLKLEEGADEARAGLGSGRPFTIVLLLDLTRLGAVRVDIGVHGDAVRIVMQLARESALHQLRGNLDELRTDLEAGGLEVRALQLRNAPQQRLPVSDLVSPPREARSTSWVDLHV